MKERQASFTTVTRRGGSPAAKPTARGRVCIVFPPSLRGEAALGGEALVLGRQPEAGGLAVDEGTVSRRHATLTWNPSLGMHEAQDLGSRNGSSVDGVRLEGQPRPLVNGSIIRVGDALLVYEQSEGLEAPDAPAVSREALPGEAAAVRTLRAQLGRAAADPAPALIIGQSGTGKERLAAELHRLSGRSGKLVPLNCAALSAQLVESQLFGHVRGAFTGAVDAQPGMFRAAHGGTLFLDEIGELPLALQPKLLRAIQEGEVHPVGSAQATRVDVRVVAATNRDLSAEVDGDRFRRDLYARLALWELRVPALYERRLDILPWIARLHGQWRAQRGLPDGEPLRFDVDAALALLRFAWPSNLRGIERLIHDLEAQGRGGRVITAAVLPRWLAAADKPAPADGLAAGGGTEPRPRRTGKGSAAARAPIPGREEFVAAFEELAGSVRGLAKRFGRDRRQIYRWIDTHGLKDRRRTVDDE
jgi:transcriptional regulator with GAF, ATPase, and Fis domain